MKRATAEEVVREKMGVSLGEWLIAELREGATYEQLAADLSEMAGESVHFTAVWKWTGRYIDGRLKKPLRRTRKAA